MSRTLPGPWWKALLAAALVPAMLSFLGWMFMFDYEQTMLDDGHVFECDGCGGPIRVFSEAWFGIAGQALAILAALWLIFAALLVGVMAWIERKDLRAPLDWEIVGFVAALPLLFTIYAFMHAATGDYGPAPTDYLYPPILLALLSLFASNAARRMRHGKSR